MKKTEMYLCQSYCDDKGVIQDCTCGKCEKKLKEKEGKWLGNMTREELDKAREENSLEWWKDRAYELNDEIIRLKSKVLICPKSMSGNHYWSMGMYEKYPSCEFCGIFDDRVISSKDKNDK